MLLKRLNFCVFVIVLVGSDWCDGLPRPCPQFLPVLVRLDASKTSHRLKTSLKVKDDKENSIYEDLEIKPLASPADLLLPDEKENHNPLDTSSHKTVTESPNESELLHIAEKPNEKDLMIPEEKGSTKPLDQPKDKDVQKPNAPKLLQLSEIPNEKAEVAKHQPKDQDVEKPNVPKLLQLLEIPNEQDEVAKHQPKDKDVEISNAPKLLHLLEIPNEKAEVAKRPAGRRPHKRRRPGSKEARRIILTQNSNFALKTINDKPAHEVLMTDKASVARDLKDATESPVVAVRKLEDSPKS